MLGGAPRPLFRYDLPPNEDPIRRLLDKRAPWMVHGEIFSQQSLGTGPWLDQGWKLHVSATPLSAPDVLERALDVLLSDGVRFKVIGSLPLLAGFNNGYCGATQLGKFITVYPSDDVQAVRLASALDKATYGLRGPRVPTDRPLRPDSLVHYRYGAIIQRSDAEATGLGEDRRYDLLDQAGRLTEDVRLQYYLPPPSAVADPFEEAGVYVPRPRPTPLLNGRYLVNNALSQPARGSVFRAVDLGVRPARLCLIKEAWHDVGVDQYGRDARDLAANEARILSRRSGDPLLPDYYDTFELNGDRYLALEYLEGTPLDRVLNEMHWLKEGIGPDQLAAIGLDTAAALAHLHEIGIVFRDFKPGNIVETPAGAYRLIDFGIAYEYRDDSAPALGLGTPPFHSPAQYEGLRPSPADDIFGWGAVLHALACGEVAWNDAPRGSQGFRPYPRRPVNELRPSFPVGLAAVIDRAVAWNEADRYTSMGDAHRALAAAADAASRGSAANQAVSLRSDVSGTSTRGAPAQLSTAEAMRLAREVGDTLCDSVEERGGGLCWAARREWSEQASYGPDLYSGTAGIALYLAELAHATGSERYADAARGAARWLAGPAWGRGRAQHGLHCGEGGVAYFFLRLAELLDEPGYVRAAELRMRRLNGAASRTTDLMYGTAGTLMALTSLYEATGEQDCLAKARAIGEDLVAAALPAPEGKPGRYWSVEASFPGGPAVPYLGLLHGAAGLGLALARLAVISRDDRYLTAAESAAQMLLDRAVPDETGLRWPRQLGDLVAGLQAHCHGAGGIAQFFLRLNVVAPNDRYLEAAAGGARTIASQFRSDGKLAICHGLSGSGHILLDAYQALRDESYLELARECGAALQRFRPAGSGQGSKTRAESPGVYVMDEAAVVSPDLMLGYAGAGSFLLRLALPDRVPDLILGQPLG